tara:strand:- start:478 stop:789 length:312 start_codon:yes stop_codon:yes gene_type:complete
MKNGMMGEIEKLIKNKVFRIHDEITELIPSVNGRIGNDDMIDVAALGSIQRATRSLTAFVEITEDIPEENHTPVQLKTDLIVMRTSTYQRILKQIQQLEDGNK